jgi:hypothetical protein
MIVVADAFGREVAARLGVRTIGILGVLIEARRRQFIPDMKTLLQRLETEAGFWIAPSLRNRVLALAGEKI